MIFYKNQEHTIGQKLKKRPPARHRLEQAFEQFEKLVVKCSEILKIYRGTHILQIFRKTCSHNDFSAKPENIIKNLQKHPPARQTIEQANNRTSKYVDILICIYIYIYIYKLQPS